jgi:DNA polymerase elongation subunit (family B)
MHKRAQVIVTMHASKHKTRTKKEHIINEILKVLIEERQRYKSTPISETTPELERCLTRL